MTDPNRATAVLADVFPRLDESARARLLSATRLVEHPAHVVLCNEGELEHAFYVIVDGSVDVFKVLEGQRLLINQMKAGAHFGEISLLLDMARTATIVTAEPTRLLEIDRALFNDLLRRYPDLVIEISGLVLRRFLNQEEKHLMEIARLRRREVGPPKVFLSYARSDAAFATRLANNLLKQQIEVWLDVFNLQSGKSWARQIGEALEASEALLVVLSPDSVASENVEDEWNWYLDHKRPTVTVRHLPCNVPYRLAKLQYIDFHQTDYEQAVARLAATLLTLD